MATRMQQRRGTAQQWTDADPRLESGEIGFETDTNQFKIGDGVNVWSDLSYFKNLEDLGGSFEDYALANAVGTANGIASLDSAGQVPVSQLGNIIDGAPELLNTINELAAAINDNATFANTVLTSVSSAQSAAESYADGLITDEQVARGNAIANAVSVHNNDTTDVHGIANTAALITDSILSATETSIANAYTLAIAEARSNVISLYTDAISTHGSETTNVHGIADTTVLATATTVATAKTEAITAAANAAATAISDHNSDTTSVHGIANTAALALTADVNTALDLKADLAGPTFTGNTTVAGLIVTGSLLGVYPSSIGLGAVDNTSDADKPVSTATQTALDLKADLAGATFTGNVEVDGSLVVDGNLTVNGNTFAVSATSITISDNMVQLAHQNMANTVDLGLVVGYNNGSANVHSGIVRDVSDSKWKLFKDVTSEPTTTVDFGSGSLDALAVGALEATTVTPSSGVVFTDGTQTKEGVVSRTPIIAKTASYTLSALTERDSLIEVASSSATTITIPTNSSVAYPIGTSIDVLQTSTGQVTIAGAGGVTVNATPGLKLRTQWSGATLFKRAENTWVVYGDLSA
jgi:hypothetical protein